MYKRMGMGLVVAIGGDAQVSMGQNSGEPIELAPVTITATPFDQPQQEIAQPASILRGEELR